MDRIQAAIQRARQIIADRRGESAASKFPYIMYGHDGRGELRAMGIAATKGDHQAIITARILAADRGWQLTELMKTSSGALLPA